MPLKNGLNQHKRKERAMAKGKVSYAMIIIFIFLWAIHLSSEAEGALKWGFIDNLLPHKKMLPKGSLKRRG
jgi:hypothetical protein